jgi:hypothetical protein
MLRPRPSHRLCQIAGARSGVQRDQCQLRLPSFDRWMLQPRPDEVKQPFIHKLPALRQATGVADVILSSQRRVGLDPHRC